MAPVSVFDPVYAPSSLWTTKRSGPRRECTMNSFCLEAQVDSGEMPSSSAAAKSKALNEEPGWRCPLVARLKGLLA